MRFGGYSAHFTKRYRRLVVPIKKAFANRLELFLTNPHHELLDNHPLKGEWKGYRSINVTGDWRAIFKLVNEDTAYFVEIDTHHNLYGT